MDAMPFPSGSEVYVGAPALPPTPTFIAALETFLGSLPALGEAYLPQCHFPQLNLTTIAVVIVPTPAAAKSDAAKSLPQTVAKWLDENCPPGLSLVTFTLSATDQLVSTMRQYPVQLRPRRVSWLSRLLGKIKIS